MIKKITVLMLTLMFVFNSGSVVDSGIVAVFDNNGCNIELSGMVNDGPLFFVEGEDGPDIYG